MKKFLIFISILLCVCVVAVTFFGISLLRQRPQVDIFDQYESKLREVVGLLDQVYVDGYDTEGLGDILSQAAVAQTGDRWSYYMSAADYADYIQNAANEYVGVGITVQNNDGEVPGLYILSVNPKGSAYEAGLQAGDIITAVDGKNAADYDLNEISDLIKGEEGTTVQIDVLRDGNTLSFTVTRKVIEVEVVIFDNIDGIGYIKIDNFQTHCAERTIEAVETLRKEGVTGLVFDVRFNPGGRKDELCKVLDHLLPEGPLFRSVNYKGEESIDSSSGDSFVKLPMAVLVNGDSYSAAEFFAAALQEYEWATVVGTQTVGKGNYQQAFRLSDGSAVSVSTGHYSTPKGVNLEGVGITPDMVVEVDQATYTAIYSATLSYDEDPQLQAALDSLKK